MEMRQLTTDHERNIFAACLAKTRANRGVGFQENGSSGLGKAHIAFGNVYAIFENESDPPEQMVGGFIVHDLATLPQSYHKPDLSHLPPRSVLEGSELWSATPGLGRIAASAAAAVTGILQAKAILVYPMLKPVDLSAFYGRMDFAKACEPIKWPYMKTITGEDIWAQPMILEGEKLEDYVRSGFEFLFGGRNDRSGLRLTGIAATRTPSPSVAILSSASRSGDERNGSASH